MDYAEMVVDEEEEADYGDEEMEAPGEQAEAPEDEMEAPGGQAEAPEDDDTQDRSGTQDPAEGEAHPGAEVESIPTTLSESTSSYTSGVSVPDTNLMRTEATAILKPRTCVLDGLSSLGPITTTRTWPALSLRVSGCQMSATVRSSTCTTDEL